MISWDSILMFAHLLGLGIAVGSATVKLVLLLKCKSDHSLVPVFVKISKPITQLIVFGLILLTLSGIVWLLDGYPITTQLIVKLIFVLIIWILGPIIDKVIEPKFNNLAQIYAQEPSTEFLLILKQYILIEVIATGFFYVIIIVWVFG